MLTAKCFDIGFSRSEWLHFLLLLLLFHPRQSLNLRDSFVLEVFKHYFISSKWLPVGCSHVSLDQDTFNLPEIGGCIYKYAKQQRLER